MGVTLKQLEAFVWVADLGSFRKAAERLNTTQPNISTRIASLEATLKTVLMDRDAGSIRLTPKGEGLLAHARAVLHETDALISAAGDTALFDGTLRLGVTEMIVHTWLQHYLRILRQTFPNLNVELTVDLSATLENGLKSRALDLALQNGPFTLQTSGMIDLGHYPLVWVAHPSLNATAKTLHDHPILTHGRDTSLYGEVSAYLSQNSKPTLVPSSNLDACRQMTLQGMGVATLPRAMVQSDIASGNLREIDHDWTPEPLHFFARYIPERTPQFVHQAAELAQSCAKIHK